eukprot:1959506-Rhodomonas_salina.1
MLRDNGLKISGVVLYVAGRGSGMFFSGEGEGLECRTSVSGYASAFRVLSITIWSCPCTTEGQKGGSCDQSHVLSFGSAQTRQGCHCQCTPSDWQPHSCPCTHNARLPT